jgi:hypothetical protein
MADLPPQNPGLTSNAAHNAAAALVEMYRGILVDNEREKQLLRIRLLRLEDEIKNIRTLYANVVGVQPKVSVADPLPEEPEHD